MIVTAKANAKEAPWMFMRAFTTRMWILFAFLHLAICFVVWIIEKKYGHNPEFRSFSDMLWFSVTIFFFAYREPIRSGLARFVVAPWLLVLLVVTACFTASLSSMLTVSQIKPSVLDIETLLRTNATVGCNGNSFIFNYLHKVLKFPQENIKRIASIDEYPVAFEQGNIRAAFFIAPHVKVFLAKYCNGYIKSGPLHKQGGLGFVFRKGSRLAADISEAVVKLTGGGQVDKLEKAILLCVMRYALICRRFVVLLVFSLLISAVGSSKALIVTNDGSENHKPCTSVLAKIGCVIDYTSRVGKEQRTAIEMAVHDHHFFINSSSSSSSSSSIACAKLDLLIKDSHGNPAKATATAIDLITSKQVEAIIGTLTSHEAAIVSESAAKELPFMSLNSPAILSPPTTPFQPPANIHFQMANDVVFQTRCIAAVVGHFNWRKVTAIYESDRFSGGGSGAILITLLSDSLRSVNSMIEHHRAFPSLSLLSDPEKALEDELQKLNSKSNRVFIVFQFSLSSVLLLFKKAKRMGMMEQGYVWIVSDEIASVLDSVESSFMYNNMRGVIGVKTSFADTSKDFKRFKSRFRRMYGSKYPEEEENSSPSIFALRAYDSITAIAKALAEIQGKAVTSRRLSEKLSSTNFKGLSGRVRFKHGMLEQPPTFEIINVVGKSYQEIVFWSEQHGFSADFIEHNDTTKSANRNVSFGTVFRGPIYWPGGTTQTVPWRRTLYAGEEKVMRIAVPASGAFHQFVSIGHGEERDSTRVTGFTMDVFEAVWKRLPYQLPYILFPFYGSYDQMVQQVYHKGFDAAVGDIGIFADRFKYVDFTQPYVNSGLDMIVTVEPDKVSQRWIFMQAFSRDMWLRLLFMHFFVCSVVLLIESQHGQNHELKGFGVMLWFSVTVLFFAQREPLKCNLARFVLAPWFFVILVIGASFTASLSSMFTVSQIKPSVLDVETLLKTNAKVGCNRNSFICRYLTNTLNFKPENIIKILSIDAYPEAFHKGDIKAAFFMSPHAEVFLAKYCNGFVKSGTIHELGGLGFALPKGSPLTMDISRAIIEVIESEDVQRLENAMHFSFNCTPSIKLGVGPEPFSGLFSISAVISAFALLITLAPLVARRLGDWSFVHCRLMNRGFWRWACDFLMTNSVLIYGFHRPRASTSSPNGSLTI